MLQALETIMRSRHDWIKAADLREQVGHLLGYSSEQIGHAAQWIGHILIRLQLHVDFLPNYHERNRHATKGFVALRWQSPACGCARLT